MLAKMRVRPAWILLLVIGCAKGDTETECLAGQRRCVEGAAQRCTDDGRWTLPQSCPEGSECRTGACVSACGDACLPGVSRCAPEGVQTCTAAEEDGCGVWGPPVPCEGGTVCQSGACLDDCAVGCNVGDGRCLGAYAFTTCTADGQCPGWADSNGCPDGEECSGGRCVFEGACSDQCREGELACFDGTNVQRCVRLETGCLDWAEPEACAEGAVCRPGQGCAVACADECGEGETRCFERGRQACVRGPAGCFVWGAVEACEAGTTCAAGDCVESCVDVCELGARRCTADAASVETCVREGGCTAWGAPLACNAGTACVGKGDCGVCTPGDREERTCGFCGNEARTCGGDGQWGDFGECGGQGECRAGAEEACGNCGVRRCGDDCRWGPCEGGGECRPGESRGCGNCGTQRCNDSCRWGGCDGQGVCAPGSSGACGECGMRSCNGSCQWEGCNNGDGRLFRDCNACGWQFCCPNGNWCNCAAHYPSRCGGRACVGSGQCQ